MRILSLGALAGIALVASSLAVAQAPNGRPRAVSVTPNFGTGYEQEFRFLWSDPDGFADLSQLQIVFSAKYNDLTQPACYLGVAVSSKALTIMDTSKKWSAPVTVNSDAMLETDMCKVDAAAASLEGDGNQLALTMKIQFTPAFAGPKYINMRAWDRTIKLSPNDPKRRNGFDWSTPGVWTVGRASTSRAAKPMCMPTFSPTLEQLGPDPLAGTVEVIAQADCRWSAESANGWLKIDDPQSHTGSATLHYSVGANATGIPRLGSIRVNQASLAIQQSGTP